MMDLRRLGALSAMVLGLFVTVAALSPRAVAAPPPSTAYPPDEPPDVVVVNPTGPPGYSVEVVVTGCRPGERVVVTLGTVSVETICGSNPIQGVVVIPAPALAGIGDVVVTFPDREVPTLFSLPISVLDAGSPSTTVARAAAAAAEIPRTGSDNVFGPAWAGLVLLVSGAGLLLVARSRASRGRRAVGRSEPTSS